MEKGYRLVQCPGCPAKLRLAVSEADYGKKIEVTCPKCEGKFRTTIPTPAGVGDKAPPDHTWADAKDFCDTLTEFFGDPKKK